MSDVPLGGPFRESGQPSFGTRAQGSARISQLAKGEPFKNRVTTKGFVRAIFDNSRASAEDPEAMSLQFKELDEFLTKVFEYSSGFPRIVHVGSRAASWIYEVPLNEIEQFMEALPNAESLGNGWWSITVDERLKPIFS